MNVKLLLPAILLVVAAVACAEGVDATDPSLVGAIETSVPRQAVATSEPSSGTRLATTEPTATPSPPVSPRPTATSASRPVTPVATATAMRQPTATPIRIDPRATATPLWAPTPTFTPVPTAIATVVPTATPFVQPTIAAAPEDLFTPLLNYQYTVPSGWSEHKTESALVLTDSSGKITVTISEQAVERWRFQTVISLGASSFPERPEGWSTWSSSSVGIIRGGDGYEFQFVGTKNGQPYRNFVQWFLWGDVHVQVSLEVPSFDWDFSTTIRSQALSVLQNFEPHDGTNMLTSDDVLASLFVRLDDRPSNIYDRDEALRRRIELTCREIYTNHLQAPEYLGAGLWQVIALVPGSAEAWWVFEPTGSIMTLNSNLSRC